MINIVGIGGTTAATSSTQCALAVALRAARGPDVSVREFDGPFLSRLPFYGSCDAAGHADAKEFVGAIRAADGIVVASPGYHGSLSGLIKNGLDYLEETAGDDRIYLDRLPVGLIVTAYGWQATGSTLAALRSIVHALRAWPTPFGAAIKTRSGMFLDGDCVDDDARMQIETVGRQVAEYARLHRRPA